jgi:hypothetical protein
MLVPVLEAGCVGARMGWTRAKALQGRQVIGSVHVSYKLAWDLLCIMGWCCGLWFQFYGVCLAQCVVQDGAGSTCNSPHLFLDAFQIDINICNTSRSRLVIF